MSNVTVYGKPGCRACVGTTRQFKKNGVSFEYIDVTQDESAFEYVKSQGVVAMPYVEAPTGSWSGLDEAEIDKLVASK